MSAQPPFAPTNKRRSFRPSTFKALNPPNSLDALTDSLRASLMSVGMRVRKSVPEGYKTTTKPKFSIYEQTAAAYPELQPFGGFNKTPTTSQSSQVENQGLGNDMMTDAQLEDAVDSVLQDLDSDLNGWDTAASSQESNLSTTSSLRYPSSARVGRKKRTLRDDEEAEPDFSGRFGAVPMEREQPLRPIAQPRSRRPAARRVSSDKSERSVRFATVGPQDDFGEADFLMPDRNWE